MKRPKFVYVVAFLCLTAAGSLAQSTSPTQKNKEKAATADSAGLIYDNATLIKARIKIVYDGDTVGVEGKDNKIYSIRLRGVDAPEKGQDFGGSSRKHLSELIEGKVVTMILHEKDLLNRYIGSLYREGQDVGLKQIESGMAWHFKKYGYAQSAEDRKRYAQAEVKARNERLGLWKDNAPIPPWEYAGEAVEPRAASAVRIAAVPPPIEKPKVDPGAKPAVSSNKTYVLGPRGGCYYLNESGAKVYVKDKSLCGKPQP